MKTQTTPTFDNGSTQRLREAILANDANAMVGALVRNANPDGKIEGERMSFLDYAAANLSPYMVALLLEFGAVADGDRLRHLAHLKCPSGSFLIHFTVSGGFPNALSRLLDAGVAVDVLTTNYARTTALQLAKFNGCTSMVRQLLDAGADEARWR